MTAIDILYSKNLKRSACREGIINVVLSAKEALSENQIRERLAGNFDRTTFYRSFKTLEESRIIHKIVVDNQLIKYALDATVSKKQIHPHFYCSRCQSVICMDNMPIPEYRLPNGFSYQETEVIIKGVCAICQNKIE